MTFSSRDLERRRKKYSIHNLEANERAFFERCRQWNLKLNAQKVKRCQKSVRYMGHLITPEGIMPDPEKVKAAIMEMQTPNDITSLKRFLGMVNYLSKFMPSLSDMIEPLRRLEDKDAQF